MSDQPTASNVVKDTRDSVKDKLHSDPLLSAKDTPHSNGTVSRRITRAV